MQAALDIEDLTRKTQEDSFDEQERYQEMVKGSGKDMQGMEDSDSMVNSLIELEKCYEEQNFMKTPLSDRRSNSQFD